METSGDLQTKLVLKISGEWVEFIATRGRLYQKQLKSATKN